MIEVKPLDSRLKSLKFKIDQKFAHVELFKTKTLAAVFRDLNMGNLDKVVNELPKGLLSHLKDEQTQQDFADKYAALQVYVIHDLNLIGLLTLCPGCGEHTVIMNTDMLRQGYPEILSIAGDDEESIMEYVGWAVEELTKRRANLN